MILNQPTSYTIVGITPEEIQKKFDLVKDRIGLSTAREKIKENHFILKDVAHFAIKRTFYLKDEFGENTLLDALKDLSFQPIEIQASRSGMFESTPYGNILYIEIDRSQKLLQLHDKVKNLIDQYIITKNPEYEGKGYIPHLSIIYNLPKEKAEEANSIVNHSILPINFVLGKIYFLKTFDKTKDERELVTTYTAS